MGSPQTGDGTLFSLPPRRVSKGSNFFTCAVSCCGQTEKAAATCWDAMTPDGLVKPSERPILPDLHRSLCRGNIEQDEAEIHWAARHPADLCVVTQGSV